LLAAQPALFLSLHCESRQRSCRPGVKLQRRYVRLAEFEAMLKHYDPTGKFRNEFISSNLYSS
jgi:hypothetical protein